MKYLRVAGVCAGALTIILSGCSSNNSTPVTNQPPAASAPMTPAQVQAIENDPKVSPKMKAALRSGQTPGN